MTPVAIGLIGAVQRAAPAVADIWLQWTGIPDVHRCAFDVFGDGQANMTVIQISPHCSDVELTRRKVADFMKMPDDAPERRSVPIRVSSDSPWHGLFWSHVLRRDSRKMPSPLEFWWVLACIRYGGPLRTTAMLLKNLGLSSSLNLFNGSVIEFVNPTFNTRARTLSDALKTKAYEQPTAMNVYFQIDLSSSHVSRDHGQLTVSLIDETARDNIAAALMEMALTATTESED